MTILLVLLVFNDATLQSEAKTVTLYISDDDSKSGQESDPASWQTSRNLVSDHEYVGEVSNTRRMVNRLFIFLITSQ